MSLYKHGLNYIQQNYPSFNLLDSTIGVVTAGDTNVFGGVQALFLSLKGKINFICIDIGFTEAQKRWAFENGMTLKYVDIADYHKTIDNWQTWFKPLYIMASPYEYTIWMDSDCLVVGDLSASPIISNKQTFFLKHWLRQKYLHKISENVYKEFPVQDPNVPTINAGVVGINKKTHKHLLDSWCDKLNLCLNRPELRPQFVNSDEGILTWTLQKNSCNSLVKDLATHNRFANITDTNINLFTVEDDHMEQSYITVKSSSMPSKFFREVLQASQGQGNLVLHFSTALMNRMKYWKTWTPN